MPSDTVAPSSIPLPDTIPAPPILMIDAAMQAALETALAQAQSLFAAFMANFNAPSGDGADTVKAAGDTLTGTLFPPLDWPPGAELPGAIGLLQNGPPAMVPLDVPMLQPASLSSALTMDMAAPSTIFRDTVSAGGAIDLGAGIWLRFGDMAEINGTEH